MQLTPEEILKAKGYINPVFSQNTRVDVWLDMASFRVGRSYFGDAFPYALALMAQHIAACETRSADGSEGGRITSKREGDLAVSFGGNGSADSSDLGATSYGEQYAALLKQYSPVVGITGRVRCWG